MARFLKVNLLVWLFILSGFSAVVFADQNQVNAQDQWGNSAQLVERSGQENAASQDPVLAAITQAKKEVNQTKQTGINNIPQQDVTVDKISSLPVLKPNYKVVDLRPSSSVKAHSSKHTYGPVKRSDHLWQIARDVRPNTNCSIAQTALAIFAINSNAFNYNNINGLMYGKVLKIPHESRILRVSKKNAARIIVAQNRAWQHMFNSSKQRVTQKKIISKNTRFSSTVAAKMYAAKVRRIAAKVKMPVVYRKPATVATSYPASSQVIGAVEKQKQATDNLSLTDRVTKLESDNQFFQDKINGKFDQVNSRNEELQKQVQGLEHNFTDLRAQLLKLEVTQEKIQKLSVAKVSDSLSSWNEYLLNKFGRIPYISLVVIVLLFLIALLVWLVLPNRDADTYQVDEDYNLHVPSSGEATELSEPIAPIAAEDIAQDEYDFMSGPGGLTTKIDLARVYIDMGDKERARELLDEVMAQGNDEQKHAVQELLTKL